MFDLRRTMRSMLKRQKSSKSAHSATTESQSSRAASTNSTNNTAPSTPTPHAPFHDNPYRRPRKSASTALLQEKCYPACSIAEEAVEVPSDDEEEEGKDERQSQVETLADRRLPLHLDKPHDTQDTHDLRLEHVDGLQQQQQQPPTLAVQEPTPDALNNPASLPGTFPRDDAEHTPGPQPQPQPQPSHSNESLNPNTADHRDSIASGTSPGATPAVRPTDTTVRRQSIVNGANARLIKTLLDTSSGPRPFSPVTPSAPDYFSQVPTTNIASMLHRKIWVKRAGASPTMVSIREDDLVDDVRDMILKKYANSLGRSFDSPDVILRIVSRAESQRDQVKERMLGPEEEMCRTLDAYYPGGQTVDEALIIDVPQRRTPRPSPRAFHQMPTGYSALDDYRPAETGTDYFPQMPAVIPPSNPATASSHDTRSTLLSGNPAIPEHARSISVLNTGQVPPLPSPGGRSRLQREHRPKYQRQHTSSPTIIMSQQPSHASNAGAVAANPPNLAALQHLTHRNSARPRLESTASDHSSIPAAPPLPTPPAPEAPPTGKGAGGSTPPTPNGPPPHRPSRGRKTRKPTPTNGTSPSELKATTPNPSLPSSLLDGSVPPINVLIVEDNLINLRLLEAFMKRLKVRWSTAMNGQIAVNKWRAGGFHLVLMDIQLPIMSGLEATKEIRRLERVNGIGVFSSSTPASPEAKNGASESLNGAIGEDGADGEQANGEESAAEKKNDPSDDKLSMEEGLFKSPVIIVALTASSLQSDRHEALAAGCNDFLTKPVNFVWLERKVKEWGCMQALIDFDGWRKWRDFASDANVKNKSASGVGEKKDAKGDKLAELAAKKAKREKRVSADAQGVSKVVAVEQGLGDAVEG